jgi:hypothetical protein
VKRPVPISRGRAGEGSGSAARQSQGSHDHHSENLSARWVRPRRSDQSALAFLHGRMFGRKTGIRPRFREGMLFLKML